jgi:hypothetical protein
MYKVLVNGKGLFLTMNGDMKGQEREKISRVIETL